MKAKQLRIANIERLRILAAFGIVWFHMAYSSISEHIGYAGLPVFLIVFCAFLSSKPAVGDVLDFARKKAKRLLGPWLFWSVVYLGLLAAKQLSGKADTASMLNVNVFFTGSSIHLWYLPYAFIVAVVIQRLQLRLSTVSDRNVIAVSVFASVVLLLLCGIALVKLDLPSPFSQWVFGLPAVALGFTAGRIFAVLKGVDLIKSWVVVNLLVIAVTVFMTWLGYTRLVVPYAIAVVLVSIAFIWQGRLDGVSKKMASLTFGIYLVHPLVGSALHFGGFFQGNAWLMILAVFIISSVLTLIMQHTPLKVFV